MPVSQKTFSDAERHMTVSAHSDSGNKTNDYTPYSAWRDWGNRGDFLKKLRCGFTAEELSTPGRFRKGMWDPGRGRPAASETSTAHCVQSLPGAPHTPLGAVQRT